MICPDSNIEPNLSPDLDMRTEKLTKIFDKYIDDPMVKRFTSDKNKLGDWSRLYNEILNLDFELNATPTLKELKRLDKGVSKYLKNMKKLPGNVGKFFKLPAVILNKFPVTKRYFHELGRAADFNRAYSRDIEADLNDITKLLNRASGETGLLSSGFKRSDVQLEYKNRLAQYEKFKREGNETEAQKYFEENMKNLHESNTLSTLDAMHDLMVNPYKSKKQDPKALALKYDQNIVEAANIWHLSGKGGKSLKDRLWKILGDGLKDNIEMLKERDTGYTRDALKVDKLEQLYNDYFAPNAPLKEKNYFPRQVIDIAPTMSRLSEDIWSNKVISNQKEVGEYINEMINKVTANLEQSPNILERGPNTSSKQSQDVIGILDAYAKQTIRFNHNARVSKLTVNGLRELKKLKDTEYEQHAKFFGDYINSTHEAALGINYRDSKLANISRAITSYQFISKLGFNPRSAFKNATQSLQHWVWWGTKGLTSAYQDYHGNGKKEIIANEMKELGYEFINIQELAQPRELLDNIKMNADGTMEMKSPGIGTKITDMLDSVARVSGKPMEWVENKFNRGVAFKIAFLNKYKNLTDSNVILRNAIESDQKQVYKDLHKGRTFYNTDNSKIYTSNKKLAQWDDLSLGQKTQNEIIRKSSAYATDMVREIHYLYDPYAKPQALRSPGGAVLGQFSTYSINFFEYQRKIAEKAKDSGDWLSPESWRLYRLGSLYAFITGLSAVTNTAFNNVVENDTWERIKQLDTYIGGTPEEKEKAFYGKGPIVGTFGGPFISDVMSLGTIMGFGEMSSMDFQSYRSGYKAAYSDNMNAGGAEKSKVEQLTRLLNTAVGRQIYTNIPRVINGTSLGTVIGQELSLYNTPELKPVKNTLLKPLQNTPFPSLNEYFTPDKRKGRGSNAEYRKALKNRFSTDKRKTSRPGYSDHERDLILESLKSI